MGIRFNADEVLGMAVQIEKNGAAFYRKAASLQPDEENAKFLTQLAEMEDRHEQTFMEIRDGLTPQEKDSQTHDPDDQASLYLEAMADAHPGEGSPSAADALTGSETMADILKIAIELEKKSILFYVGLKPLVPPKLGSDKIDTIIAEERSHIVQLGAYLKKA